MIRISILLFLPVYALGAMWVFVDVLNIRECPSLNCEVVGRLSFGQTVNSYEIVLKEGYDWVRTDHGWVALQFVDEIPLKVKGDLPLNFDLNSSKKPLSPDYVPSDLVEIPLKYSLKRGLKLRKDAMIYLGKMLDEAEKCGLRIRVVSAYRSWKYQRWLYEKAIEKYGPDQQFVAKPGRSEHQLGLAVDLVGEDPSLATEYGFKFTKEYEWLRKNSQRFCFFQSYGPNNPYYEEEPWHFRFTGCKTSQ